MTTTSYGLAWYAAERVLAVSLPARRGSLVLFTENALGHGAQVVYTSPATAFRCKREVLRW